MGIRTEKRQMMEKERQQKVVGVALSITRSSEINIASDINNHLRSIVRKSQKYSECSQYVVRMYSEVSQNVFRS